MREWPAVQENETWREASEEPGSTRRRHEDAGGGGAPQRNGAPAYEGEPDREVSGCPARAVRQIDGELSRDAQRDADDDQRDGGPAHRSPHQCRERSAGELALGNEPERGTRGQPTTVGAAIACRGQDRGRVHTHVRNTAGNLESIEIRQLHISSTTPGRSSRAASTADAPSSAPPIT